MDVRRLITRIFAVLVIVGLVIAPFVTPAAAKHLVTAEMTDMAGDMPCCPEEQKSNSCQDCPNIAMCTLTIAQAEPPFTNDVQLSFQTRRVLFALHDLIADGLMGSPPDHPPRILT